MNRDEYHLTCAVADYLGLVLNPKLARFTHLPLGEKRDAKTGAKLKRMGVRAGWPDFIITFRGRDYNRGDQGQTIFIELKASRSGLSGVQKDFSTWCNFISQPYYLCRSIDDVEKALKQYDVPTRLARTA